MGIEVAFEGLAREILNFVNYGITIVMLMISYEVIRIIMHYFSKAESGQKITEGTLDVGKKVYGWGEKIYGKEIKAKKWVLKEFIDTKKLKRAIEDFEGETDDDLRKKINRNVKKEHRSKKRAFRRIRDIEDKVEKANIPAPDKKNANKIVERMDFCNKQVVKLIELFDTDLAKPIRKDGFPDLKSKKKKLLRIINTIIKTEEGLIAELEKLKSLMKVK